MPIERIIELECRGLRTPFRRCTSTTAYVYGQTKFCKKNLRVGYYLLQEAICLASPNWAQSRTKLSSKM